MSIQYLSGSKVWPGMLCRVTEYLASLDRRHERSAQLSRRLNSRTRSGEATRPESPSVPSRCYAESFCHPLFSPRLHRLLCAGACQDSRDQPGRPLQCHEALRCASQTIFLLEYLS